jgi:hypothetical protein
MEQPATATELPEETQPFEVEGVLEAIFANAPELLAEPLTATEVPTHALDSCGMIDVDLALPAHAPSVTDEAVGELPVVATVVDSAVVTPEAEAENELPITPFNLPSFSPRKRRSNR